FQLTARRASDLARAQAGDFNSTDSFTQVICDDGQRKPCASADIIQFIEHTSAGTRNGTRGGVTFEFDWTPPNSGEAVTLYVAANAANGNGDESGDHIYTSNLQLTSTLSGTGPVDPKPAALAPATRFSVHNLVSDLDGKADQLDPNLVNPWGMSMSPTGPFWVSNNHTGSTTVYNTTGQPFPSPNALVIKIAPPASGSSRSSPTGQVFNSTSAFEIAAGKPATFLFATEDGTISGWNTSVDAGKAIVMVGGSGSNAVYKGLALATSSTGPMLYAANFSAGAIDVFDATLKPATVAGAFQDPNLPAGFAPFNIQKIGRRLLVTYALQDGARHDSVAGLGNGIVNVFDTDGNLRQRLISNGPLNSPWGLALAPQFFGDLSSTLLVANFGDCRVNAFDLTTGEFLGTLQDSSGAPIVIEGLWALQSGNGHTGGDSNAVYFTAGISGGGRIQDHGLFGSIQVVQ
ncbi:MAG: TIGR03118 family protein, partial [Acidobacteriota bacterium]|nr:TIGR03118 family protein [Acidobacteriota bacterium]